MHNIDHKEITIKGEKTYIIYTLNWIGLIKAFRIEKQEHL